MNTRFFKLFVCMFSIGTSFTHCMEGKFSSGKQEQAQKREISLKEQYCLLEIDCSKSVDEEIYIAKGTTSAGIDMFILSRLNNTEQFYPFYGLVTHCTTSGDAQYSDIINLGTTADYWKECKKIYEAKTAKNNK